MAWPWQLGYGSVNVIGNVTMRYSAYDFLLTFCSNYGSISCRFWDIQCRKMSWRWNRFQRSLKVNWKWCHSIDCVWFPISVVSFWDLSKELCSPEIHTSYLLSTKVWSDHILNIVAPHGTRIIWKTNNCWNQYNIDLRVCFLIWETWATINDWIIWNSGPWKKGGIAQISSRHLNCSRDLLAFHTQRSLK